jgi:CheY-like chemotaxis protein/anti-sigma regulatory factor (Ser/Thr protein kinase)
MHALGLFAAVLKEKVTTPEQHDLVGKIEDSVNALEAMFNTLLDVSRLDTGLLTPHPQIVPLRPLLHRLEQEWIGKATEKGLRFTVRSCDLAVRSDPILLARIINNLVKNAIRYTGQGGVLVACRRRGNRVLLQVWDSGVGIAPEDLGRIFDEFYQVNNPERNRTRGLGLGLFIVRRLSQLLGHSVDVRSRPGRGSVFSVRLPIAENRSGERLDGPEQASFERQWVLLIEDDTQAREAMSTLLEGWGLQVIAAADLDTAERSLAGTGVPALIVSDYRLGGGITGIEAVTRLRRLFDRRVAAILVSGDTSPEGMAEMQEAGIPVLHKPVRPAKLRALVNHLVAHEEKRG